MSEKDISLTVADAFETVIDDKIDGHIRQDNTSHLAEVVRIDPDGTHWVHVYGGADLTPVTNLASTAQVGDVINVTISNNSILGMGNISSPAPTKTYVDKQNTGIIQIVGNAIGADLSGLSYKDGVLKSEKVVTDKLQARVGEFQQAIADRLDVKRAAIEYAKIDAANITAAQVKTAWIDKLLVDTDLLAKEGTIYKLEAVEVDATNITAGTLDVNRLIITQEDQQGNVQKYLVHYEIPSGGTEPVPVVEKLDGNIIEPRTVTADRMVANTITVNEITAQNLQGINGWINLTQGTFQYGQDPTLGNNGIWWDGTDLHIKANELTSLAGTVDGINTRVTQNSSSITSILSDVDNIETMIRQYNNGVLVCKTNKTVGALVNADGSFDVVSVSWSNGNPTTGAVLATFGATSATIGKVSGEHIVIDTNYGLDFYHGSTSIYHMQPRDSSCVTYFGSGDNPVAMTGGGSTEAWRLETPNFICDMGSTQMVIGSNDQSHVNTVPEILINKQTTSSASQAVQFRGRCDVKDDTIDRDKSQSSIYTNDVWSNRYLRFIDKDGEVIGNVRPVQRATDIDGHERMELYLGVYSEGLVDGTATQRQNALRICVDDAGNRSAYVDSTFNISGNILRPNSTLDSTSNTNGLSSAYNPYLGFRDKNDYNVGYVQSLNDTSGNNQLRICAQHHSGTSYQSASLTLAVNKNNTPTLTMNNQLPNMVFAGPSSGTDRGNATFRSLVAGDLPTVTLAKGGTGKTNTDVTYYGYVSLWYGTATTGSITIPLADTAKWTDCLYLIIRFRDNEYHYGSVTVRMGSWSSAVMATLAINYAQGGYVFIKSRTVSIDSGGISTVSGSTCDITVPGTTTNTSNHIYLVQILGLK